MSSEKHCIFRKEKKQQESYEIHYMLHFHLLVSLCPFPRVRRADAAVLASWLVKLTFFKSQFQAIPGHFNTNVKIEALASEFNDYRSPPSSSFWSPATTLVLINQGEVGMKSFKTPTHNITRICKH